MKKLIYVLALLPFMFCSCEDKVSDQQGESGENGPIVERLPVVKCLEFENGGYYGFEYDSYGRMNRISYYDNSMESESTFAQVYYEDQQVTKILEGGVDICYKLDEAGKVVKASPTFLGNGDEEDYEVFEYDNDNYISSVSVAYDDGLAIWEFKVTDGNYTCITTDYESLFVEYTDYPNSYSIDLNYYLLTSAVWTPFYCFWFSKFPGATCPNLIKSIDGGGFKSVYHYSFDDFGRVSSITMNKSYKDDGEKIVVTLSVKYKE